MPISIRSIFCNTATEDSPVRTLSTGMYYISNATYNITSNSIIMLDTKDGQFSVKLPPAPVSGDIIFLIDVGGNLEAEPVKIISNGSNIFRSNVSVDLTKSYMQYTLFYFESEIGWIISESDLINKGF